MTRVWQDFVDDPLTCPEAEVTLLFGLETIDESTPINNDTTTFYLRTAAYARDELFDVLNDMLADGYDYYERLFSWHAQLMEMNEDTTVFVRL
ncbi:hypothetical protein LTR36_002788 [Oleoguttula mirabilis]|uniref:Uncharacterized protein n=1 Tax=Oleoguttula mirabilis TaxID=1507867 RepID=A0AAV9JKK0_9PEZI|nr:hypothetical protein LTR36_002788 [Oleoguttula mirabilis]